MSHKAYKMYRVVAELGSGTEKRSEAEQFLATDDVQAVILMYRRHPAAKKVYVSGSW